MKSVFADTFYWAALTAVGDPAQPITSEMLPAEVPSFEYRHTPDPREIDQVLLPMLEEIRGGLSAQPINATSASLRRSHEN